MNNRTLELITAAARVLAHKPEAVLVTERNGKYHIDGAPGDLANFMGKQRQHANAIEFLAQQIEPAALVHVASRDSGDSSDRSNPGMRTDWSKNDEGTLKGKIESLLKFIHPSGSVQFRPAVRESVYIVPASYISTDVVGALHVLFRAYGRRHGRYVTVTLPDESQTA